MFTNRANEAVAHMLAELAEQRQEGTEEAILLRWLRARRALLARKYPEIYDTAVRDELWKHLSVLGLSDASIAHALAPEPPIDSLFGPPSVPDQRADENRTLGDERQDVS